MNVFRFFGVPAEDGMVGAEILGFQGEWVGALSRIAAVWATAQLLNIAYSLRLSSSCRVFSCLV